MSEFIVRARRGKRKTSSRETPATSALMMALVVGHGFTSIIHDLELPDGPSAETPKNSLLRLPHW